MDRKKKKGRKEGRRREAGGRYKRAGLILPNFSNAYMMAFPTGNTTLQVIPDGCLGVFCLWSLSIYAFERIFWHRV